MEDWIGIIFGVGYIVFIILNSTRKKREEVSQPTIQSDWKEENLDQEATWEGELQTVPCSTQMMRQESEQKARSLNDLLASLGRFPQSEEVRQVANKAEKVVRSTAVCHPNPHQTNSIGQQLCSSQGARRAFIYSEIFNRKY